MKFKNAIIPAAIAMLPLSGSAATPQSHSADPVTGADTWKIHAHGVEFALTQILPEQAQAFYVNRGFTLEQTTAYAASCVYMTVLRNDNAPGTIHFVSNDWSVFVDGKPHPLVSVDSWVKQLEENQVKRSALIAFRWAQFPPEQEYEPGGDWNQGMLSTGVLPGSEFDITAHWDIRGRRYATTLRGVRCAR